ncbi:hypothetical protein M514_19290 [Trichuris suis]|uniref:Reverse transcriptase Ty1/copia-type domain-containing protein n=1 Tax=Trichuris suis TaxID=68888 RepID=A0A085NG68_9BILA|nr:hypothetical protein M514_19290 [Trichuris suis]
MLLISANDNAREKAKQLLNDHFECKYIGKVSHLLGVKFSHGNDGSVTLTQQAYIQRLLQRFHLEDAKGASTPVETRPLFPEKDEAEDTNANVPYKELIGSLLYLAQRTRPDISFAVEKLAQYCSKFTMQHWNSAKRVLKRRSLQPDVQTGGTTRAPTKVKQLHSGQMVQCNKNVKQARCRGTRTCIYTSPHPAQGTVHFHSYSRVSKSGLCTLS